MNERYGYKVTKYNSVAGEISHVIGVSPPSVGFSVGISKRENTGSVTLACDPIYDLTYILPMNCLHMLD